MSFDELLAAGGDRVTLGAELGALTTYHVGGRARVLVTMSTLEDARELVPLMRRSGLPLVVVGNGSNLLVADGELDVVAVHLRGAFATVTWRDVGDDVIVDAGAAVDLPALARRLGVDGVLGFSWAVGVPGTIGGAVVMNAGGHGSDMATNLLDVTVMSDELVTWEADQIDFGYRQGLRTDGIVTSARLRLRRGDPTTAAEEMRAIVQWRRAHQPGGRNAGSVFRNPEGDSAGRLLESVGVKGLRIGTARVSEKHANFIIADDQGLASDVYALMVEMRRRVYDATGITLHAEHHLIGFEALG